MDQKWGETPEGLPDVMNRHPHPAIPCLVSSPGFSDSVSPDTVKSEDFRSGKADMIGAHQG
jgi:hypothetical protein